MMQTKSSILRLIVASAIGFGLVGESNAQYTNTLTPDLKVIADTSRPGFIWNVFADTYNELNSPERTEDALAGRLLDGYGYAILLPNVADPAAQGVARAPSSAPSPENATIKFEIETVINMGVDAANRPPSGFFKPDDQMPGLPSLAIGDPLPPAGPATGGVAGELITYLDLPAGLLTMGVASNDGFQTMAGKVYDAFNTIKVGEFTGGDNTSGTLFYINVLEAGMYAFRTTYENGGGNGHIEWFTVKPDGTKVLVNDTANGGVAAYRASTTSISTYIKRVVPEPAPRQVHTTSPSLQVVLADGTTTTVGDASITLSFDGSPVTPVTTRNGSLVTVTYTPPGLRLPGEHHTASLSFTNSAGTTRTEQWSFYSLKNIVLPAPVLTENFDSYAEGSVPSGWTLWNFTDGNTPGENLDDLNSDSYLGWVVVSRARLAGLKDGIFVVAPGQTFNGVPVTLDLLSTGNVLYAESDVRSGNQVQFATTKPFNLSTVANPVLSFSTLMKMNQDQMDAVEYSVDGGTTWLPVVYYLDYLDTYGDIRLNPNGTVNAVATFTNAATDIATWTDNGVPKGGNYGDGIAAPISQALGRFIAPRDNDNSVGDNRVEIYRLPMASHKSDVRLRFAQLGTGSWYFGVDNLAFYDVAAPVAPQLSIAVATGNVTISWIGDGTLLEAMTLAGPWTISWNQANPQTSPTVAGSKFYKIGSP